MQYNSLRAGRSGDRIPIWAIFSAPVQAGRVNHPASFTMGIYRVSFPGGRRLRRGVDHPPQTSAEVKDTASSLGLRDLFYDEVYTARMGNVVTRMQTFGLKTLMEDWV
jgi:hypothetical protein